MVICRGFTDGWRRYARVLGAAGAKKVSFGGFMLAWFQKPAGPSRRAPSANNEFSRHAFLNTAGVPRTYVKESCSTASFCHPAGTSWWWPQVVVHLKPPPWSRYSGSVLRSFVHINLQDVHFIAALFVCFSAKLILAIDVLNCFHSQHYSCIIDTPRNWSKHILFINSPFCYMNIVV